MKIFNFSSEVPAMVFISDSRALDWIQLKMIPITTVQVLCGTTRNIFWGVSSNTVAQIWFTL
jgi:hypothetical protein